MILKSLTILGHRTFINGFFKQFPQHRQYKTFSPKPFTKLIHEFHCDFIESVLSNRAGADLPLRMGNLKMIAFKSRGYLNFANYKKGEGFISKFSNNHTEGLTGKIFYSNHATKYRLKDKTIWTFEPEAPFKKKASISFLENYLKYEYSPSRLKISYNNSEFNLQDLNKEKIKIFLKTYDEFYMN